MLKPVTPINLRVLPVCEQEAASPTPDWVLPDKLEPPRQRINAVARVRLLERLQQACDLPLTLLLAPPGFGKTTLLAQWHQRLRQMPARNHAAWLSLEEEDGEPARFLAYVAMSLIVAGVPASAFPAALLEQRHDFDVPTAVSTILGVLGRVSRPVVLILDDYDRAASPELDALVTRLVEHGGPRLHLLLASRTPPALPLARLSTRGCLERIDARALPLDDAEARAMLGGNLPDAVLARLQQHTEGWPAALQLASLWLDADNRRGQDLEGFSGQACGITDYLAEQVFADLPADTQEFLLQTSLLERFDATLADAVRERRDSDLLLSRLDRFHGLLVPLGDGTGYRYHPLFADFLHRQLQRHHPERLPALHIAAAHAHAARGLWLEAVRHAVAGGDTPLAARTVADAGGWQLLLQHGSGYVRSLLAAFPADVLPTHPALLMASVSLRIKQGELTEAQHLLERFRSLPDALRAPHERDYVVLVAMLRGLFDQIAQDPQGPDRIATQAAALDDDDHIGRGTLLCISASACLERGRFDDAERMARLSLDIMQRADREIGAGYARLALGHSLFYRGQVAEAIALYRQVEVLGERQPASADSTLQAMARCLLAEARCESAHVDEAEPGLDEAIAYLEQHDGRIDVLAAAHATALTLTRRHERGLHATMARLDQLERFATARHLNRLQDLALAWRIDALLDQPDAASRGLDLLIERAGGEASFAHALGHGHGWRLSAALGFALARWHRQGGRSSQALQILRQIETASIDTDNHFLLARARARIALTLQQRGEIAQALPPLRQALDHVAHTCSWQVVLELGAPAKALLRCARQQDPEVLPGTTLALTMQTLLERLQHGEDAGSGFSEREREMLSELAFGHSNKQIARRLNLSENTVKFHLKNLYRKLDANSRAEALSRAQLLGLLHSRVAEGPADAG